MDLLILETCLSTGRFGICLFVILGHYPMFLKKRDGITVNAKTLAGG